MEITGVLSVVGYAIIAVGIVTQIAKTAGLRSVKDISGVDVFSRLLATAFILTRAACIADFWLALGSAILAAALLIYFLLFLKIGRDEKCRET